LLPAKITKFGDLTQNNGLYAFRGHSRSPTSVPFESRMQLPNCYHISHHLQVIPDYWSNFRFIQGVPLFNAFIHDEPLNS